MASCSKSRKTRRSCTVRYVCQKKCESDSSSTSSDDCRPTKPKYCYTSSDACRPRRIKRCYSSSSSSSCSSTEDWKACDLKLACTISPRRSSACHYYARHYNDGFARYGITDDNVGRMYAHSSSSERRDWCLTYILRHFGNVCLRRNVQDGLTCHDMFCVITDPRVQADAKTRLLAVLEWIKYDEEGRKCYAKRLLGSIPLALLTDDEQNEVRCDDYLRCNRDIQKCLSTGDEGCFSHMKNSAALSISSLSRCGGKLSFAFSIECGQLEFAMDVCATRPCRGAPYSRLSITLKCTRIGMSDSDVCDNILPRNVTADIRIRLSSASSRRSCGEYMSGICWRKTRVPLLRCGTNVCDVDAELCNLANKADFCRALRHDRSIALTVEVCRVNIDGNQCR